MYEWARATRWAKENRDRLDRADRLPGHHSGAGARIGQSFAGIVTGVNQHGTFVRALEPHVEGMVVRGGKGLDVGDRVTVKLVGTNPERGFIDFAV